MKARKSTMKASSLPLTSRPLACKGFVSYRCKSPYGWVMIGAKDHADALSEAKRSSWSAKAEDLEVWDGCRYVPVSAMPEGCPA